MGGGVGGAYDVTQINGKNSVSDVIPRPLGGERVKPQGSVCQTLLERVGYSVC